MKRIRLIILSAVVGLALAFSPSCDDSSDNGGNTAVDSSPSDVSADSGSPGTEDAAGHADSATDIEASKKDQQEADTVAICQTSPTWTGIATSGLVYVDTDNSTTSIFDGQFDARIDSPMAGVSARLLRSDGGIETATTCEDGSYGFDSLADGQYLVSFDIPNAEFTTKNHPEYLAAAIDSGKLHIVTFGDSVPKIGDAPFFPERLGKMFEAFAEVKVDNIAIPGTTSEHWMPSTFNFKKELVPLLPSADVVIISLGGNDVLQYVQENAQDLTQVAQALEKFPEFVQGIRQRVIDIANAIRAVNPQVDIVYCLYPNYAESDLWNQMLSGFGSLVTGYVDDALTQVRASILPSDRLLLVDLYGGTKDIDLDDVLYDYLHFNDAGQQLYAEQIFVVLGGIRVGDAPLGLVRDIGVAGE